MSFPADGRAPFIGLRFFDESDVDLYCGRDEQVDELLLKLARTRLVAVIGPSGCGKSSLVRAGLIPGIRSLGSWHVLALRPGGNPIGSLAAALERTFSTSGLDLTLRRGRLGLWEAVQQCQPAPGEKLLVIVDQFEELFRFQHGADFANEAAAFVKLVLEATADSTCGIYVVITMRSDYLGDCSRFRDLPERINEGLYLVPRMRRDQLERAITGPLRISGDPIAPRLTQRLLNDVGDDPDQLPVLQHALLRTWTRWRETDHDGPIDLQHYEYLGGLHKALENHAEQIFHALPTDLQSLTEVIFRCLTQFDEARAIRRPTSFQALVDVCGGESRTEGVRTVLDLFRAEGVSFLMPERKESLEVRTIVDITHESLIRQWARLQEWARQEGIDQATYFEIERRASQATSEEDNLKGVQLAKAITWLEKGLNPSWAIRYGGDFEGTVQYIERSRKAAADAAEAALYRERAIGLLAILVLFAVSQEAEALMSVFALLAVGIAITEVRRLGRARAAASEGGPS